MKTILELSHIKARQYFLESQNYCNMQFPKYIDFKPVIEYVQNSVGNKELSGDAVVRCARRLRVHQGTRRP